MDGHRLDWWRVPDGERPDLLFVQGLGNFKRVVASSLVDREDFTVLYAIKAPPEATRVFSAYTMTTKKDAGKVGLNIEGYGQFTTDSDSFAYVRLPFEDVQD